jgi:transposase
LYLSIQKRDGREYLSIQKSYWNKETKSRTSTTIKALGFADVLRKDYNDPVAHFRQVAKEMSEKEKERRHISIDVDMDEKLPDNARGTYNFGYAVPMKIYHQLWLDDFFNRKMVGQKFEFNTNSIMIMLVMSRILSPDSKKSTFEGKGKFFERFDFSLDDVYRALSHYAKISDELQRSMHERVASKFGSDTRIVYYDVTNYYFQINKPDDNRKYGKSKENRKKPIIQMGLAMDTDGVPLHYKLFPGNTLDKETFRSVIGEVRRNYGTGRIIVVADMGIITGDNIYYLTGGKKDKPLNGYVFSFSVRGGTAAFQEYVLDENGYTDMDGKPVCEQTAFKIKSRLVARDIYVTMNDGKKKTKQVYEKQVVFWNRKYFDKARAERAELLAKAEKMIKDQGKYTKATSYGAASYILNIDFDKSTGEIRGKDGKALLLDTKKIAEEEKYDGYYSIVTSEIHMTDSQIIDVYHGLWEIEETFKVTKSVLSARPVYLSEYDHIDAHFLVCFISLIIIRLIQKATDKKYSAAAIVECLNKIECIHEHGNIYLFGYKSEISDALGNAFGIDFTKKRLQLKEIKKILEIGRASCRERVLLRV